MVTVENYHVREGKETGKEYISLELIGDVEMIQSATTGRHYATMRRCFVFSTFDEKTAERLVGKQIPGNIVRVQCEEYEYTVPETGEVIQLAHRYDYVPESNGVPVKEKQMA